MLFEMGGGTTVPLQRTTTPLAVDSDEDIEDDRSAEERVAHSGHDLGHHRGGVATVDLAPEAYLDPGPGGVTSRVVEPEVLANVPLGEPV